MPTIRIPSTDPPLFSPPPPGIVRPIPGHPGWFCLIVDVTRVDTEFGRVRPPPPTVRPPPPTIRDPAGPAALDFAYALGEVIGDMLLSGKPTPGR